MSDLEREIEGLAERWYLMVAQGDSVKDRDCHWYIETSWSYGSPATHTLIHDGDLYRRVQEEHATRESALLSLREHLLAALG